jgi:DNA-directed RNA polymerase specialized sigma24 family protein
MIFCRSINIIFPKYTGIYLSFNIQDQQAVEDIVAQVFCDALEYLSSFQWRGVSFGAWLYQIAYHMMMDYYKKPHISSLSDEDNIAAQDDLVEEMNHSWSLGKKCMKHSTHCLQFPNKLLSCVLWKDYVIKR